MSDTLPFKNTRRFHTPNVDEAQKRQTTPLDVQLPPKLRFVVNDLSAVIDLPLRAYTVIGRRDPNDDYPIDVDLGIFDAQRNGVSRYHAVIQAQNGRISIKDYNSANGTLLNGYRLRPMFGYRLRHGDELTLGRMLIQVHFLFD